MRRLLAVIFAMWLAGPACSGEDGFDGDAIRGHFAEQAFGDDAIAELVEAARGVCTDGDQLEIFVRELRELSLAGASRTERYENIATAVDLACGEAIQPKVEELVEELRLEELRDD